MKYQISLEYLQDYTTMSIMAGELYLIDEQNRKTHLSGMVLKNALFIENDTKIIFPILENNRIGEVNDWCVQICMADLTTEKITIYGKYFRNNGEKITYENGIVTVWNEQNEFVKTDSLDTKTTPVQRTKTFEIHDRHNHYFKRYWDEPRADMYTGWGKSWWYFETDPDGTILKQIEEYENGIVQCYDLITPENIYGGLGKLPLPFDEFREYGIYKEDFDSVWNARNPILKNDLYKHFDTIRKRPALFLGGLSISKLDSYIHGYQAACSFKDIEEELNPRWHLFHEFTKRKTGFYESTSGWCNMILTQCEGDEEKAIELFFEYFDEFRKGETLAAFIKTLVPKDKHDMDFDKITDFYWYDYQELKPIIPELLTWLQDYNWPVATPIARHLQKMLPDILPELMPILEGNDSTWKYWILQIFFIETKSEYWKKIQATIEQLAFNPSENDKKDEVNLLALEILK